MKKMILLVLATALFSNAYAAPAAKKNNPFPGTKPVAPGMGQGLKPAFARKYGTAGCGLGNLIFKKENQIFAATTNGSTYNQGFGITFGTLNCEGGNLFTTAENMDRFMLTNKIATADSIARGEGEIIVTLASLMNCSGSEAALGSALQSEFHTIFPSHTTEVGEITDRILTVVGNDDSLSKACNVHLASTI